MNNRNKHERTIHDVIDLTQVVNHHHHDINAEVELQARIEQELHDELVIQRRIKEELIMVAENHCCMEQEEEEQCRIQEQHDREQQQQLQIEADCHL